MAFTSDKTGSGFFVDSRHQYDIIGACHNVALPVSYREKRSFPARGLWHAVKMGKKEPGAELKTGGVCLVALLLEGHLDGETAEQKIIAQLGSIEERFLTAPICTMREFHQGLFWVVVDRRLDNLDLDTDARAAIEAQISKKIPRPGDEWALWGVTCIPCFDPK